MSTTTTVNANNSFAALTAHTWSPQPEPARLVQLLLDDCLQRCSFATRLSQRMLDETGTRLIDWLDHFGLPGNDSTALELSHVGYVKAGCQPDTTTATIPLTHDFYFGKTLWLW